MKKTISTLQLICLLSSLFIHYTFVIAQQRNEPDPVKIIALLSSEYKEYFQALEGFEKVFKNSKIDYILNSVNNIKNNDFNPRVLNKINEIKPDLILALGTRALTSLEQYVEDIPIVFSMVLNPYLTNSTNARKNVTGVTMSIPVLEQFSTFKKIVPNMKTIGVVYSPEENSELIKEAGLAAKQLDIDLVEANVNNEREVPNAINNLTRIVDVIWLIVDKAVSNTDIIKYIILEGFRNDIPVMGLSAHYVEAGAVCAVSADYNSIGAQAGTMAVKILNGVEPFQVPYEKPRSFVLYINERVAASMGISINEQIRKKAVIK